jgi:LPXTG-motif cell wall-anchored protein
LSSSVETVLSNNSASSSVETVVVEIAPPAPTETTAASPVPVTTLAEAAPSGPAPTTAATAATAAPVATPDFADTLPLTGSSLQPLWLIGIEALLVGLGLLVVARRPRALA